MFDPLPSDVEAPSSEDDEMADQTTSPRASTSRSATSATKEHVPPINIFNVKVTELYKKLTTGDSPIIPTTALSYKLTQFGTKFFCTTVEHFRTLRKYCVDNQINCFTHALPAERKDKYVVYDLPSEVERDDIIAAYASLGLTCADAKPLSIKNKRHADHNVFVVYFDADKKVKYEQAAQLNRINGAVCKVVRYSKNSSGPTQCANCLAFGHGKQNCHMPARCVRCGQRHESSKCVFLPANAQPTTKIPTDKVACANCKQNHPASYKGCPSRHAFMQMQSQLRMNAKPAKKAFTKPTPRVSYPSHMSPNFDPSNSYAAVARGRQSMPPAASNDLFSPSDLSQILQQLWSKLSKCRSRQEQVIALGEYVIDMCARTNYDVNP